MSVRAIAMVLQPQTRSLGCRCTITDTNAQTCTFQRLQWPLTLEPLTELHLGHTTILCRVSTAMATRVAIC